MSNYPRIHTCAKCKYLNDPETGICTKCGEPLPTSPNSETPTLLALIDDAVSSCAAHAYSCYGQSGVDSATGMRPIIESAVRQALTAKDAEIAELIRQREEAKAKLAEITPLKNSDIRLVIKLTSEVQDLRAELLSLSLASEGMKTAIARIHRAWVYFVNNPNAPIAATASMDGAVHNALEALSTPTPPIVQQVVEGIRSLGRCTQCNGTGEPQCTSSDRQECTPTCGCKKPACFVCKGDGLTEKARHLLSLLGKDGKDAE